jgi:hypothetical protein
MADKISLFGSVAIFSSSADILEIGLLAGGTAWRIVPFGKLLREINFFGFDGRALFTWQTPFPLNIDTGSGVAVPLRLKTDVVLLAPMVFLSKGWNASLTGAIIVEGSIVSGDEPTNIGCS